MEQLEILRKISGTKKSYIQIKTTPLDDDITQPWKSKFGGIPCLPSHIEHPRNENGDYLSFLSQINFSETPRLKGFPEKGVLQFYIDTDDSLGKFSAGGYKVLYFPDPESLQDIQPLNQFEDQSDIFPIECPHLLSFALRTQLISPSNPGFESIFKDYIANDSFKTYYYDVIQLEGEHQIGGYPTFVQDPPAFLDVEYDDYELLLKIDIDDHINWGDSGVANFLIHKNDLANLDFNKVFYWWDCS
jgi:uncharacterized protein YwqG